MASGIAPLPSKQPGIKKFITFEGGDGVGKTEQIHRLAHRLRSNGADVVVTREPGGTESGEALRSLLLGTKNLCQDTQLALFLASRCEHLKTVIYPALAKGKWVLCDRFIHSTLVYQGFLAGKSQRRILQLHRLLKAYCVPSLTFLLDTDPVVSQKRAQSRHQNGHSRSGVAHQDAPNHFDLQDLPFHQRVQRAYQSLHWGHIVRVPAGSLESVDQCIWHTLLSSRLSPLRETPT